MNERKKRERVQFQRALFPLNYAELHVKVLICCEDCSMITQELVKLESREEYRSVYSVSEWRVCSGQCLLPFLKSIPMRLTNPEGRAYPLTEFGAHALHLLDPQATVHALELSDIHAWTASVEGNRKENQQKEWLRSCLGLTLISPIPWVFLTVVGRTVA